MNFNGIAVLSQEPQSQPFKGDGYMGCAVVTGHPEAITLQVRAKGNGITPIAVYESQPYEYPSQLDFELRVPVTWKQQDSVWIPHTRWGEQDFMNVILIDSQLHIRDVQVSLLSRKGRFYIMAQLVYEGWIRMGRMGGRDEVLFIPGKSAFAYPGANYQFTWKGRGGILATMARIVHGVLDAMGSSLNEVRCAEWEPREVPALEGWKKGHVLFFCPITNTGLVYGEDWLTYHVWGNNLVDVKGPVHMLEPMAPVYFRPGEQKEGQAFPSVKSCKPA